MAITITTFGRNVLNEQFILQAVTDNPTDYKYMRLEINGLTFENEPEVGTNDTFRFELNGSLSVDISPSLPQLLTYNTSNNNTEIDGDFVNFDLTEIEEDGTTGAPLQRSYYLKPYNLFREQAQATFDCGDDGSSSSKFLTNSAQTLRVKKDEFIWLFVDQCSFVVFQQQPKQEIVIQQVIADGTVVNTDTYDVAGTPFTPSFQYVPNVVASHRPNPKGFQIKFSDYLTNDVDRVLVFIRDISDGTVRSEIKIIREYTGCEFVKLWWLNQYNAPELTYMEGREIRQVDNQQFGYVQSEPVNPTAFEGGRKLYANKVTKSYQLNTGNKSPDEIIYLSEMLHAGQLVIEKDGVLIPVRITNTNFNNFNSKDSIFNLEVDLQEVKDTLIY